MGTMVYGTGTRKTHYHRVPDCPALVSAALNPTLEFDIAQLRNPELCAVCFPDQPVIKVMHTRCCYRTVRPCKHNGGVLVYDPEDSRRPIRWAWPEDAHKYSLVNSIHIG